MAKIGYFDFSFQLGGWKMVATASRRCRRMLLLTNQLRDRLYEDSRMAAGWYENGLGS
jgi:hypothetical protein